MGLFGPSPDGQLTVEFYDDPKQNDPGQGSEASVRYSGPGGPERLARDFIQYATRVVSNMGQGNQMASRLVLLLNDFMPTLSKESNLLDGPGYFLKMVEPSGKPVTKRCSAKFYATRGLNASFSWGGEDYYPPMSVILFLQHAVNTLDADQLKVFSTTAASMMV